MAITRLSSQRGDRFKVTYRDGTGKQRVAGTYGSMREAEKAYGDAKARVRLGVDTKRVKPVQLYEASNRRGVTLEMYVNGTEDSPGWLDTHRLGAHARANYDGILRARVLPALGNMAMTDITTPVIAAMFRSMEDEGCTNALISKVKTILSSAMQSAAEDPSSPVVSNPVRGVRIGGTRPTRRKAITREQFSALLDEIPEEYRLFLRCIVGSSARVEEVTSLTNDDLEITDAGAWLRIDSVLVETRGQQFTDRDSTKTGRSRRVKIPNGLAQELSELGPGYMFTRPDGRHISLDSFRKGIFHPAAKRAGIPPEFTVRDLRRVSASWLRLGGADLEAVRDRLGHSSIATTDRYLGEDRDHGDSALDALGDV
jgi:integrase